MSEELKPCPFCGSPAEFRLSGSGNDILRVTCTNNIGYFTPCISFYECTTDDAARVRLAKKWNDRPMEDTLHKALYECAMEQIPCGQEEVVIAKLRAERDAYKALADAWARAFKAHRHEDSVCYGNEPEQSAAAIRRHNADARLKQAKSRVDEVCGEGEK